MKQRKVAIYARVSTEHEAQISALENQVQYYDEIMEKHPEWELYDRYIDEGITGTSTQKRKNFIRMIKDAEEGRFDLIITREVSRFARNTVDTLQETRKLKKIGIEVWFTEDNIWTMNDEDGELRLTIMATLAQNESRKTSQRVKAGQMVSFMNAVPYGTGNILGYDRVAGDKRLVINPEQAETVRMIFNLYIRGYGYRQIQYELERQGRRTSMGCKNWSTGTIAHTLSNPFYCGTIVYRKEFVPDYLEQKRIRNNGEIEQIVVEGKHEPIISKEDYAKVQEIRKEKNRNLSGAQRGKRDPCTVWGKKLICNCGSTFNRRKWTKVGGKINHAYQCLAATRSGSVSSRLKQGLSIEGICAVPMVPEWKLELMAGIIFREFWNNRQRVIRMADQMLEECYNDSDSQEAVADRIKDYQGQLQLLERKLDNLLEMRLAGDIAPDKYNEKRDELEGKRDTVLAELEELNASEETAEDIEDRITVLKYVLEQKCCFDTCNIPSEVVDAFVDKIEVYNDHYKWYLKLFDSSQETVVCSVTGKGKAAKAEIVNNTSEGSEQHRQLSQARRNN